VDTKQLMTFVTLAEEKNYAGVARRLNYAPSTLMEHIRSLEEELGCRLTKRNGRQTCLTAAGEEFLRYAAQLLALQKQAVEAVESIGGANRLRVATAESLGQYSLFGLFNDFTRGHAHYATIIRFGNCAMFPNMLLEKQIDFGFIYDLDTYRSQAFESVPLFWEPLYFVAHPEHPLAQYDSVRAEDFAGECFAMTYEDCCYAMALKRMLLQRGVVLKSQNHLGSVNMIKSFVLQNYGIALLPRSVVKEELARGSIARLNWAEEEFAVLAQVIYLKGRELTEPMEALLKMAVQYAKSAARQRSLSAKPVCMGKRSPLPAARYGARAEARKQAADPLP